VTLERAVPIVVISYPSILVPIIKDNLVKKKNKGDENKKT